MNSVEVSIQSFPLPPILKRSQLPLFAVTNPNHL